MLIQGDVLFTVKGFSFHFKNRTITLDGVSGLAWEPLDAERECGRPVTVKVDIPHPTFPLSMHVSAQLTRERELRADCMGLKFQLTITQREALASHIQTFGKAPVQSQRKFPRIPSDRRIATYPLHARVKPLQLPIEPLILEIVDLSPNGMLLVTENPNAGMLLPGQPLSAVLEPRGWFATPVEVQGVIRRLTEELDPKTQNTVRRLGLQFTRMDDEHKDAFRVLLKDVLERIQALLKGQA